MIRPGHIGAGGQPGGHVTAAVDGESVRAGSVALIPDESGCLGRVVGGNVINRILGRWQRLLVALVAGA